MRIKITAAIMLTFCVLLYTFFQLGGFENVQISIEMIGETRIFGKAFHGKYNDHRLEDIYFGIKEKLDDGSVNGEMTVINYRLGSDSTEQGWVRQFIGIMTTDSEDVIKEFKLIKLPAGRVIRAKLNAHNLVMPKPDEIEEIVQQKAVEQKSTIGSYTLERYISDRELIIDTPIID